LGFGFICGTAIDKLVKALLRMLLSFDLKGFLTPLGCGMTEPEVCLAFDLLRRSNKMRKLQLNPSNSFTDSNNYIHINVSAYGLVLLLGLGTTTAPTTVHLRQAQANNTKVI
jgi:hypothetical protein